jgi:hypothetical protein
MRGRVEDIKFRGGGVSHRFYTDFFRQIFVEGRSAGVLTLKLAANLLKENLCEIRAKNPCKICAKPPSPTAKQSNLNKINASLATAAPVSTRRWSSAGCRYPAARRPDPGSTDVRRAFRYGCFYRLRFPAHRRSLRLRLLLL